MAVGQSRVQVRQRRARRGQVQKGLDPSPSQAKNVGPAVVIVERPDPGDRRWQAALEILLEAGMIRREDRA